MFASNARSGPIPLVPTYLLFGDGACARREALRGSTIALRAGFFWCSLPELAPDPSRSAYVLFVEDGACARREALRGSTIALRAGFFWCSLPMLAPDPSRSACVLFVEDGACARREALRGSTIALRAGFFGVRFQCSLRTHPACAYVPFVWGWGLRSQGSSERFHHCAARGIFLVFASRARSGPIPLRLRTFC